MGRKNDYNIDVDLSNLSKTENGLISWKKSIGKTIPFVFNNSIKGELLVKDNNIEPNKICLYFNNREKLLSRHQIIHGKVLGLITIDTTNQLYNIGDVVTPKGDRYNYKIIGVGIRTEHDKESIIYDCICNKCKGVFRVKQSEINDYSCPHCKKVVGQNVVDSAPWMIKYFQNGEEEAKKYTRHSTEKVYPVCPYCGKISTKKYTIKHLYTRGFACSCNSNGMSFPERFLTSMLNQLHIEYKYQPSLKDLGFCDSNKRYDFYIPKYLMIIETHGIQHYDDIRPQWNKANKNKKNDKFKYDTAIANGIEHYIVLDCRQSSTSWIKQSVMNSELPGLFSFTDEDIDWALCAHYRKDSIIKKICEDYMKNYLTTEELSKKYDLNDFVIRSYLRIGDEQKWCTFNRNVTTKLKPIEMLHGEKHIGYFKSTNDVETKSVELFGKLLYHGHVQRALKNNTTYNGYTFKYVENIPLRWDILNDKIENGGVKYEY